MTVLKLEEPADPSDGILFWMLDKELIPKETLELAEQPCPVDFCCVVVGRPELEPVWPSENISQGETGTRLPSGPKTPWHVGGRRWLILVAAARARGYSLDDSMSRLAGGMADYLDTQHVKHPVPDRMRKFIADALITLKIRTS